MHYLESERMGKTLNTSIKQKCYIGHINIRVDFKRSIIGDKQGYFTVIYVKLS